MALSPALLDGPLTVREPLGLTLSAPEVDSISALVWEGHYLEAAEQVQAFFLIGCYDIRLIPFFLFGVVVEQGIGQLEWSFLCLERLLTRDWDAIGPVQKKLAFLDTSSGWLFRNLANRLERHNKKGDAQWKALIQGVTLQHVQDAQTALQRLETVLSGHLPKAKAEEFLHRLLAWLRQLEAHLRPGLPAASASSAGGSPAPVDRTPGVVEEEADEAVSLAPALAVPPVGVAAAPVGGASAGKPTEAVLHMALNPELKLLLRKLEAFDLLIKRDDLLRAAIVAQDLNEQIEHFDPRRYFPQLFADFYERLSEKVELLEPYWEANGSRSWQASEQLYRISLERFVKKR